MDGGLFPNFQRWFIALFENPVPAGMTLMEHALPTITLIALLLLVIDGSALICSTFAGRWISLQLRTDYRQCAIWIELLS